MIKNYSKIAFRNLWRHKIFSFIKSMGLAVGMTVNLVNLLSEDFLKCVAISSLIAFPIAWLAMNRWLSAGRQDLIPTGATAVKRLPAGKFQN